MLPRQQEWFFAKGILQRIPKFGFIKIKKLEIVQDFNYLGVIFNFTRSFTMHNHYAFVKALRASGVLLSNLYKVEVDPNIAK